MLITKIGKAKWCSNNKKHYTEKGYMFTKMGDEFEIKIEDATNGNTSPVQYLCDYCLEEGKETIVDSTWNTYNKKKSKKDNCLHCIGEKQKELNVTTLKNKLSKEEIIKQYLYLKSKINKIPSSKDIQKERKSNFNFMTIPDIVKVFGGMDGLRKELGFEGLTSNDKELLGRSLYEYCLNNNIPITEKAFNRVRVLSNFVTYQKITKCKDLLDLYRMFNISITKEQEYFILKDGFSKEECVQIIYEMQSKLKRPLMYDDFRNPRYREIGITLIKKYWDTMNKMKEELGLEIVQDSMIDRVKSINEQKEDLIKLCNEIYKKEGRKLITTKDIDRCEYTLDSLTYRKYLKEYGTSLRDFVESIGFKLQKEGNGLNHTFIDGEKVRSQYELDFSNLLRDKFNLTYNEDYFRDVRYKAFINNYNGMMDCDYVFGVGTRKIYIEIAGMLRDLHKGNWRENIMESKSKENYRQKLLQKEQMLKDDNLEYYILFPSDLQEDFLIEFIKKILGKETIKNGEENTTSNRN